MLLINIKLRMIIVVYKPDYKYFKEYIDTFIKDEDRVLLYSYENPKSFSTGCEYMFINTFDTNLIIECHKRGNDVSILNTEQLTRHWYFTKYERDLQALLMNDVIPTLYDYSIYNSTLVPFNLKVKEIIPYTACASEIPDYSMEISHDVAFFGTDSTRRSKILDDLERKGVSVYRINAWGDERDIEIQKCKLIINIHYSDEYKIYESIRCDRWLAFGKTVVTEDGLDITYPRPEKLIISSYDNLVETVLNKLKDGSSDNNKE